MFPCTSIAGLATGCRLSASLVASVKGTVLLCRSPCTICTLLRSAPSATMPSSRAGVVSTGRVGLVPNTILQVANACGSRPAQDKATCPPLTPACGITECNVIGCVIMAVYNAYRVFIKQTTATPPEIIPWRERQEQRFLQVGNWMAAPRYAHRATSKERKYRVF